MWESAGGAAGGAGGAAGGRGGGGADRLDAQRKEGEGLVRGEGFEGGRSSPCSGISTPPEPAERGGTQKAARWILI